MRDTCFEEKRKNRSILSQLLSSNRSNWRVTVTVRLELILSLQTRSFNLFSLFFDFVGFSTRGIWILFFTRYWCRRGESSVDFGSVGVNRFCFSDGQGVSVGFGSVGENRYIFSDGQRYIKIFGLVYDFYG